MSTGSSHQVINSLDCLFCTLPASAEPRTDFLDKLEAVDSDKPAFHEVLRESASSTDRLSNQDQANDDAGVRSLSESDRAEQPSSEKTETQDTQAEDTQSGDTDASEGQAQPEAESDPSNEDTSDTPQTQEEAGNTEASTQAEAAAVAAAQLANAQATAIDLPKVVAGPATDQQVAENQYSTAKTSAKQQAQAQTLVAPIQSNTQATGQTHATGLTVDGIAAATVQQAIQPGAQSQTNSGDTGGESKSATTNTAATATGSTSSNAATAAAFAVPDQAGSDARLPINTTTATQTVDAARQVQAQAAINSGDSDSLNTARLTRGLANAVQQRGGAVTLRLTPPEMGTVRISMQITGTSVSASFHAETASAQTLLTTQLAQLRSSLESKGMSVERLSVQPMAATAATQNTNQSQNQSDSQQQGQSQQQSAGDGRSRGQYSSGQQSSDQQDDNGAKQAPRGFFDRLSDASEIEAA